MPDKEINGVSIYYEDTGSDEESIFFAHGLLFNLDIYRPQVEALKDRYRCISMDFRGQGRSGVAPNGYDMDTLAEDVASLIKSLNCGPSHYVGLSMGGFVGLRVALKYPELLKSLTLIDSSSEPEPNKLKYKLLNIAASWFGLKSVTSKVMPILFSKTFLDDPAKSKLKSNWEEVIVANHPVGVRKAVNGVISREGVTDKIHQIKLPTMILVGEDDVATIPAKSQLMHSKIENSFLEYIPNAGHMSVIEEPQLITELLGKFFVSLEDEKSS